MKIFLAVLCTLLAINFPINAQEEVEETEEVLLYNLINKDDVSYNVYVTNDDKVRTEYEIKPGNALEVCGGCLVGMSENNTVVSFPSEENLYIVNGFFTLEEDLEDAMKTPEEIATEGIFEEEYVEP